LGEVLSHVWRAHDLSNPIFDGYREEKTYAGRSTTTRETKQVLYDKYVDAFNAKYGNTSAEHA